MTYTIILNSCSHCGLVEEAKQIYSTIEKKKQRTVVIITTMVDALSRAGHLEQAQKMVDEYQEENQSSDVIMLTSLLCGYRQQQNFEKSNEIYQRICSITNLGSADMASITSLYANTFAASSKFDDALNIRAKLKEKGIKLRPGCTWTQVGQNIYEFHSQDRKHPRIAEIYKEVAKLSLELEKAGYKYNPTVLTRDEVDVESAIDGHSERLAIAFNLIATPPGTTIQLTKNLRICDDCHEAAKYISKIRQRDIIVRDKMRLHHFTKQDGKCSCDDHF